MIDDLNAVQKKNLVNDLMAGKEPDGLSSAYDVDIPSNITLKFVCPHCDESFPMRVAVKDMPNVNRHVKCPRCRNGSFLSTINSAEKQVINRVLNDFEEWFDVDSTHTRVSK